MRQGGAAAVVVVRRQRQHAAELRGAGRVAVLEHVAATVHAGTLAVPHRIYAIDLGAREQVGLLRAPHHRGAQVLVQAWNELHARRFQMLARAPQLQVEAAQRAAAVTADETGRVQARGLVAQALHQRQPHQRLHAAQVDAAVGAGVLVIQRVVAVDHPELRQVGGRG